MQQFGIIPDPHGSAASGIQKAAEVHWNLTPSALIEEALINQEGTLTSTGALMCDTGKFTGRSPKDRFIVDEPESSSHIWWNDINLPFEEEKFQQLHEKMLAHLAGKKIYVRDAYAGADKTYRLNLRVINTLAWHNLFCHNMFLRPDSYKLKEFNPNFTILCIPEFEADPSVDGTRSKNFAVINMKKRVILIGGTAYAGEMKKGIFSVLNYLLPVNENVLSMHCSANMGLQKKDTAIFFGLSGTGKTTLSADPNRDLIGDDEHGWTDQNVFNFEGGCYAKVIDLKEKNEPDIFRAIKYGAIVENTRYHEGTRLVDYENVSVTENTRAAYPIDHIANAADPSIGGIPRNIFFLTCDAFGVIPPISKMSKGQAMYHFISGYTAKVAGTEAGVTEPQTVFSACFGAPFLPLHPTKYAEMLGKKMEENEVDVWLINTGWTGGPYGVGSRMKLKYTRAMISAALNGTLDNVGFRTHSIYGVQIPMTCPDVPSELLSPRETWKDDDGYYAKANELATKFRENFKKFEEYANDEIMSGQPVPNLNYKNN
ncbi:MULTISPECIES: phosphoenolpyruvate carboxykinase (ATP) [Reichenbachiella]|uniref:Phosphoenolpyruvate carboxykinase (ATP) n=1 Tax=Reichenbachiella agariperforans TaxID=156994 RepID=A0A1M6WH33_REIAG|nr:MULTISPECIES: phosphoenolpyruvate carboxykinase (ATP) [Reichenbachiella]MBU2912480.1 phosphoenolpyruvate carboxykinase (ATP) [Reichenbachiella agariperforans]RJE72655.1 phosphoenolpyruvate carboxykinase (ATP) [Reichenbachiella sp. MSK19-1]SHK92924.1 phosphoenolpyruvate carboxykinase (ATP) [Reichenbachiella agariperforans]